MAHAAYELGVPAASVPRNPPWEILRTQFEAFSDLDCVQPWAISNMHIYNLQTSATHHTLRVVDPTATGFAPYYPADAGTQLTMLC